MSGQPSIRISCAALCRFQIGGKYLLEINKNRSDVLTPIGGALEFHEAARRFLESLGGSFQKGSDLRLMLPLGKVAAFEAWFAKRTDRETDPMRELEEELIDEHKLHVPRKIIQSLESRYLWTTSVIADSSRKDQQGVETRYFFEIFEVMAREDVRDLLAGPLEGATALRLLGRDEIDQKISMDGFPVGDNVSYLFKTLSDY